jgi:6-phosphogluconolactonase
MNRVRASLASVIRRTVIAGICVISFSGVSHAQIDTDPPGAVFVLSNQPTENSVIAYARSSEGVLTWAGTYPTGGKGAGTGADPLGSQGSLTLGSGFLFAVNPGSNDVSMFAVDGAKLKLLDRVSSGGKMPVSVAIKDFVVYVLNAGDTPTISGYIIDALGKRLIPLPNSQRLLAGGRSAQPAQVTFSPDGDELVVTEKGTQLIDTYRVDFLGYTSGPYRHASNGVTPFGVSVTNRNYALVAEAGSGAVSTYLIRDPAHLEALSSSVPLGQTATCWIVTTGDGRFAFTANAGSGTISSLSVGADGTTRALNPVAAVVSAPLDMALSRNSQFLYVRQGSGALEGFRVLPDGSLSDVGTVTGIPANGQGVAAR